MKIEKGIIVSIQGYSKTTIEELAREAQNAGAIAIRTDKKIDTSLPVIGLKKEKGLTPSRQAYITSNVDDIEEVKQWANYVAIDYRRLNPNLKDINSYCMDNKIKVIADIASIEDYENILKNNYSYEYMATTLSVLYLSSKQRYFPDMELIRKLVKAGETKIIAEGNFNTMSQVREVYALGCNNVCIGTAISNVYKLTKKFTIIDKHYKGENNDRT